VGVVAGHASAPDGAYDVRDVVDVIDEEAFIPQDVVDLTEWVSEYYLAGPGAALAAAMPPRALDGATDRFRTVRMATLTSLGLDTAERLAIGPRCHPDSSTSGLGARQREALAMLHREPGGIAAATLAQRGISSATLNRLHAMQLVSLGDARVERDPFATAHASVGAPHAGETARALTVEQQAVVRRLHDLAAARAFHVALVQGITGSGKTEVYLHAADAVRRDGRSVLVLVPEIALTPVVVSTFRSRFGARVAIQHSGLSDGERHDQWHRIRRGDVDVVVGTRSAVFAPLARLGSIIVDEEHDASYKQEETPRYHGRDVAIMRGKLASALVILGSATPSMESRFNAAQGRYAHLRLDRRVHDRPLAAVQVVNMREEYTAEGSNVVLSRPFRAALRDRLDRREQAIVLLNRRGYATAVFCRQCGGTLDCPNCSVSLTVHTGRRDWLGRCHYCNFTRGVPRQCPTCAAPYLQHVGFGTERVEAELEALAPDARIGRVDRDTIRRRGSLVDLLERFARGDLDVLVGTQMIAKGHDFPRVTLVGVISADVGLGLADFRAAERTFQLLTQVAGRAGRGDRAGEAIIQTLFPSHYSIRLATAQDYPAFYDKELEFRRAMRYPPVIGMVNVVVRGSTYDAAMGAAAALARRAHELAAGAFVVLGPAPAPLTKLRGEHRAQFFLKGRSRRAMQRALRQALAALPDAARKATVDVDPISVL
jgi:primosomal protein N' (replication factor Y)